MVGNGPDQASVRLGVLGLQKLVLLLLPERLGWGRTACSHHTHLGSASPAGLGLWCQDPACGGPSHASVSSSAAGSCSGCSAFGADHAQESHVLLSSRFLVSPPLPQAHTKPSYSFSTTEPSAKENSLMPTE